MKTNYDHINNVGESKIKRVEVDVPDGRKCMQQLHELNIKIMKNLIKSNANKYAIICCQILNTLYLTAVQGEIFQCAGNISQHTKCNKRIRWKLKKYISIRLFFLI